MNQRTIAGRQVRASRAPASTTTSAVQRPHRQGSLGFLPGRWIPRARSTTRAMRRRKLGAFLIALLCILTWSGAAIAANLYGTVYGGSNPLPDARVLLIDAVSAIELDVTTTDAQGDYSFVVADRTYNLTVIVPFGSGYANGPADGVAIAGADVRQDGVLLAGVGVYSRVDRGLNGIPMPGLNMQIFDVSGSTKLAEVDQPGDGSLETSLMPGEYLVLHFSSVEVGA